MPLTNRKLVRQKREWVEDMKLRKEKRNVEVVAREEGVVVVRKKKLLIKREKFYLN